MTRIITAITEQTELTVPQLRPGFLIIVYNRPLSVDEKKQLDGYFWCQLDKDQFHQIGEVADDSRLKSIVIGRFDQEELDLMEEFQQMYGIDHLVRV